jgi:8-oxo-dGTP diphosphatase
MHSDYFPDSFHRVTIKGLCVRGGKVMLSLEGIELSDKWELPGGGLDFGEDIHEAFKREIQEETGLKVTKMSKHPVYVWTHRFEPNRRNIGWYYSLVVAYRVEFEDLNVKKSEECQEIKFFSKEELVNLPNLHPQSSKLAEIFDPEDFKHDF